MSDRLSTLPGVIDPLEIGYGNNVGAARDIGGGEDVGGTGPVVPERKPRALSASRASDFQR